MGFKQVSLFAVAAVCLAGGCTSQSSFEFDSLDLAPPQEELSEFSLGTYAIPIPVVVERTPNELEHRNRFQLDFQLVALVTPEHKAQLADDWARHEGKIRDHVIRVCRNASVDELQEPEFSTLKAQLMDALAAQIGEKQVRQLLITDPVSQEL
jgi:flagellar basal body-associated protein FliL